MELKLSVSGDSAYGLRTNLMIPITSPATLEQRRYNRAFLKVRQTIECTLVLWKSCWRYMDKTGGTLCYSPENFFKIIIATMVLHNLCIDHGILTELETSMDEPSFPRDVLDFLLEWT